MMDSYIRDLAIRAGRDAAKRLSFRENPTDADREEVLGQMLVTVEIAAEEYGPDVVAKAKQLALDEFERAYNDQPA